MLFKFLYGLIDLRAFYSRFFWMLLVFSKEASPFLILFRQIVRIYMPLVQHFLDAQFGFEGGIILGFSEHLVRLQFSLG